MQLYAALFELWMSVQSIISLTSQFLIFFARPFSGLAVGS